MSDETFDAPAAKPEPKKTSGRLVYDSVLKAVDVALEAFASLDDDDARMEAMDCLQRRASRLWRRGGYG